MDKTQAIFELINDLIEISEKINDTEQGKLNGKQIESCVEKNGLKDDKKKILKSAGYDEDNDETILDEITLGDVVKAITSIYGLFKGN